MDKLKVGIIGMGDGGLCNLKSFINIGVEVVAVCDNDDNVLDEVARPYGNLILYLDMNDLIKRRDVDLVVVATHDFQHLDPAEAALKAGKKVFIEKPVATTQEDLQKFKQLAKDYPRQIFFSEKYSFAYPIQTALMRKKELGAYMCGSTLYTMWNCDRIMGNGKWRTESEYNPCAGGLSHNFMTALLFADSPIAKVRATGQVLTYHENLDKFGGFDTMEGTLEFANGRRLNWLICLAVKGENSPFGHRTVTHTLQFENGALVYGPTPTGDRLILNGNNIFPVVEEPVISGWADYNIKVLYGSMHRDLINAIETGKPALHNIDQGINVALACQLAFESAKHDGEWMKLNKQN